VDPVLAVRFGAAAFLLPTALFLTGGNPTLTVAEPVFNLFDLAF
jgi:hypothetical protein